MAKVENINIALVWHDSKGKVVNDSLFPDKVLVRLQDKFDFSVAHCSKIKPLVFVYASEETYGDMVNYAAETYPEMLEVGPFN